MYRKKRTATSVSLLLTLLCVGAADGAESDAPGAVGSVTDLSGTLLMYHPAGPLKVLGRGSVVDWGDVFATRADTYTTLTLSDHSSITLGPDTEVKIESYGFHPDSPGGESAVVRLIRGRARIDTGILGTRNGDTFSLVTPVSTLGIQRARLIAEYVAAAGSNTVWNSMNDQVHGYRLAHFIAPQPPLPATFNDSAPTATASSTDFGFQRVQLNLPTLSTLPPGLYVQVIDGLVNVSNKGGAQNFSAGQFGFTPSPVSAPTVVPKNPGIQFTPPPTFSVAPALGSTGSAAPGKSNAVDCEVR
jgi:FecR protein